MSFAIHRRVFLAHLIPKGNAHTMSTVGLGTGSNSVTSMNYVGFEDLKGQGKPEIVYNQIFIEPNQPQAMSVGNIAAAGYVPGQQSYLKQRRAIWSKSRVARDLELQGFHRVHGME